LIGLPKNSEAMSKGDYKECGTAGNVVCDFSCCPSVDYCLEFFGKANKAWFHGTK
jgi:hypothetical protein